jgi:hypothetical protein
MGCRERPYDPRYEYTAFVDPSGGHKENKTSVLDVIREVPPPFSPEGVVVKFAALLRDYRIHSVIGDKYAK